MADFSEARYTLTLIAQTGDQFVDFSPYVASLNDRGVVAFQAERSGGGTGIYSGSGADVVSLAESGDRHFPEFASHPDIDDEGRVCVYVLREPGVRGLLFGMPGSVELVSGSERVGPAGPTMNDRGQVAYRLFDDIGGNHIYLDGVEIAGKPSYSFEGLPVVNAGGSVAYRTNLADGGEAIHLYRDGTSEVVAETGPQFQSLGRFPYLDDEHRVAFPAVTAKGQSCIVVWQDGTFETLIDDRSDFESFRGVLLDGAGRAVFYATVKGGSLGIYSGPNPVNHRALEIGQELLGSRVEEFALNPVSINRPGQLAIRVKLEDGVQLILRADPVTSSGA